MVRDSPERASGSMLRRIDPFCWIAAIALVVAAILLASFGAHYIQWPLVVIAILLPVFDSWANRPHY
jgi:fatty acid desaturase